MKKLGLTITDEQYKYLKELSDKRKITISNLIREALGFSVLTHNGVLEKTFLDFSLPHGGLAELSRRTGHSYGKLSYWRSNGIPLDEVRDIRQVIQEIKQEYKKPKNLGYIVVGFLGKLPHGGVTELSRKMNKPYNTVRHWHKYGIPKEHREEVKQAMKELGYE